MKPRLPVCIEKQMPPELLHLIYSFVPPLDKPVPPSPSLQRELFRIQKLTLKGKLGSYMRGFMDFVLD